MTGTLTVEQLMHMYRADGIPQLVREDHDKENFAAALALVKQHFPTAVDVTFETTDQNIGYSFWVTAITGPDGQELWENLTQRERTTFTDVIEPYIADLNWGGVVDEDEHGYALWLLTDDTTQEQP